MDVNPSAQLPLDACDLLIALRTQEQLPEAVAVLR
jgi:hypothetical protein